MKLRIRNYISFIVLFLFLINISIAETNQKQNIELGMWWITESHVLLNTSILDSGTQKLQDTVFFHKWIISSFKKYNDENVWIIEIYPHKIPANVQNDHGENFIFRLWLPEICPLDVPVLPVNWRKEAITKEQQKLSMKNERSGNLIQQSIAVLSNKPPEIFGIEVTLKTKNSGTRIQTWIKNCPWWIEWHCNRELTNRPGLISAKTINWKGNQ